MPNIDTPQYQGEKILLMVLFNAQQWGVFGCCLKWLLLHVVSLPVYLISHISLFSVWGLVSNLGSIVLRLLFAPIEAAFNILKIWEQNCKLCLVGKTRPPKNEVPKLLTGLYLVDKPMGCVCIPCYCILLYDVFPPSFRFEWQSFWRKLPTASSRQLPLTLRSLIAGGPLRKEG